MKKNGGRRLEPKEKRSRKGIITVSIMLALLTGGFVWFRFFFMTPPEIPLIDDDGTAFYQPEFHPDDASIDITDIAPKGVTNADRKANYYTFLIIGMDDGINTDTIMLASYDGEKKEANLIGIPRDSLVNVKRKVKKINAAYPAGTLNGGGMEGGVAQLKREIKTIIGFIPDFYILIDMNAFVKIIDAVEGIEVDVPFAMKYNDPNQKLSIDIPKGLQTLDGTDALKFARYRKGSSGGKTISDYDRINNQQTVIKAMLAQLLKPANLLKIPEFITIFSENVHTDLSSGNLLWFGEQLNSIRGTDALSVHTMPTLPGGSGAPNWYEYLDAGAIIELVNSTINPYNVPIKPEDVNILDKEP